MFSVQMYSCTVFVCRKDVEGNGVLGDDRNLKKENENSGENRKNGICKTVEMGENNYNNNKNNRRRARGKWNQNPTTSSPKQQEQ